MRFSPAPTQFSQFCRRCLLPFGLSLLVLCLALPVAAENTLVRANLQSPENLELTAGRTMILNSQSSVKRVVVTDPDVAKADVFSPKEIVLTGKKPGSTTLTIWHGTEDMALYTITVALDLGRLKHKVHSMFPEENELRLSAAHETVTLAGRVSNAAVLSEIMSVVQSYTGEGGINNLVQAGGVHQVMLEVRVAEMSRRLGRKLGINFAFTEGNDFGVSSLGGLTSADLGDGGLDLDSSGLVNALFRFHKGTASWTGFIDALKSEGLVKVMAEPTLIALSGQTASFLAGGEIPIPSAQGLGTTSVEYKQYGVGLAFTPRVLSEKKINIQVTPEISELDYANAVQLAGAVVPGFTTRRATTTVELADGQSFAIAGLLKDTVQNSVEKFPLLGDLPVLGMLFRSKSFQKGETELVIIVTPHLVQPMDMANQSLPTDFYREPTDAEFYLLGLMQGRQPQPMTMFGQFDGEFGHALPE